MVRLVDTPDAKVIYSPGFLNAKWINFFIDLAQQNLHSRMVFASLDTGSSEVQSWFQHLDRAGIRANALVVYKFDGYTFDMNANGAYFILGRTRVTLSTGQSFDTDFGDYLYVKANPDFSFNIRSLDGQDFYLYRFVADLINDDDVSNGIIRDYYLPIEPDGYDFFPFKLKGLYYDPGFEGPEICDLRSGLGLKNIEKDKGDVVGINDLIVYAKSQDIDPKNKNEEQLITEIERKAPCSWIRSVFEWAKNSELSTYLNQYVSDVGMERLTDYRLNNDPDEFSRAVNFFRLVNEAVYQAPRTTSQFVAHRGTSGLNYKQGEIVTYGTPKSGSFSLTVVNGDYAKNGCCILRILIPRNAVLAYHPSEDQIIFPIGAKLLIISGSNPTEIGKVVKTDTESKVEYGIVNVFDAIYIDAPDAPIDPIQNITVLEPNIDVDKYLQMYKQDWSFPYLD